MNKGIRKFNHYLMAKLTILHRELKLLAQAVHAVKR